MKVKDLIAKLHGFNPEADVFTIYDGRVTAGIHPVVAHEYDLEEINSQVEGEKVSVAVVVATG